MSKTGLTKKGVFFHPKTVFFNLVRIFYDERHSKAEDRFILLGMTSAERIIVIHETHHVAVMNSPT